MRTGLRRQALLEDLRRVDLSLALKLCSPRPANDFSFPSLA